MTIKHTSDQAAVVDTRTRWIPVGSDTPRGVKLQLICKPDGVAQYGHYTERSHWTHWHPLPVFEERS